MITSSFSRHPFIIDKSTIHFFIQTNSLNSCPASTQTNNAGTAEPNEFSPAELVDYGWI